MNYLRQSTATAILAGPFLSSSDGFTAQSALTVASIDTDLYKFSNSHPLTKTDITLAASGSANDCAHVANGYYSVELTSGNTDTLGRCLLSLNISGALPVWHELTVLSAQVYDSLIGGGDLLQVDLTQALGVAWTPIRLAKNTAFNAFVFYMRKSSDHVSPATGLTVVAKRALDGAAFANCANAAAEIGLGFYKIDLAASDLNGNSIGFVASATGADATALTIITQP